MFLIVNLIGYQTGVPQERGTLCEFQAWLITYFGNSWIIRIVLATNVTYSNDYFEIVMEKVTAL